jgi:hypothetical protein
LEQLNRPPVIAPMGDHRLNRVRVGHDLLVIALRFVNPTQLVTRMKEQRV